MKTSNKLLILLGALLFVVPIIVIAINVKINYKYFAKEDYLDSQEINNEPFNKNSSQRLAIPISKSFSGVNIIDAREMSLNIYLNKSQETGIKIPSFAKNYFTFNVDANGILNISVKEGANVYRQIPISIYSPTFKTISAANSTMLGLSAVADSLQIIAKNIESFSFHAPITLTITNSNNTQKVVQYIGQTEVPNLNIHLSNASFYSTAKSYKNLNITATNHSKIDIKGDEEKKEKYNIEKLVINTVDTADVMINNINVENLSGKISEHTKIQVPTSNLKQLFKN